MDLLASLQGPKYITSDVLAELNKTAMRDDIAALVNTQRIEILDIGNPTMFVDLRPSTTASTLAAAIVKGAGVLVDDPKTVKEMEQGRADLTPIRALLRTTDLLLVANRKGHLPVVKPLARQMLKAHVISASLYRELVEDAGEEP